MKNIFWIILVILLSLLITAGAYLGATGLMESFYNYRSPLASNPPPPQPALGNPSTSRLVIVLVDGLRLDTSLDEGIMPTLASLRAQGASAIMTLQPPSYSQTEYSVLFTGAWPELSDGPAFNVSTEDIPTWTQDDLFSSTHRAGLTTAISGFDWFERLVPASSLDESYFTAGEDRFADEAVTNAALEWLDSGCCQLTLIHLDQVDYAGHHEGGAGDPRWDEAASRSDALISEILARLDLSNDTILVIADHGHVLTGGHGGHEPEALHVPFILAGAGVNPGNYGTIRMVNLAPSAAALLGVGLPASTQGEAMVSMLMLDSEVAMALPAAQDAQQQSLLNAYQTAINAPLQAVSTETVNPDAFQAALASARNTRQTAELLPRGLIAFFLVSALVFFTGFINRKKLLWVLAGLLGYATVFHIVYHLVFGWGYSFSYVTGATGLVMTAAGSALAGLLAGWMIFSIGSQLHLKSKIDAFKASAGFSLALITFLLVPALLVYVQAGIPFQWMLPDVGLSYFALLALGAMIFTAACSPIFAGLATLQIKRKK